jgi:hypothetical protein
MSYNFDQYIIFDGGPTCYLYNGNFHRICGPSVEWPDGEKSWYLCGHQYEKSEYDTWVNNKPLLYWKMFNKGWGNFVCDSNRHRLLQLKIFHKYTVVNVD